MPGGPSAIALEFVIILLLVWLLSQTGDETVSRAPRVGARFVGPSGPAPTVGTVKESEATVTVERCLRCSAPMEWRHQTWQCTRCRFKLGCCEGESPESCAR